ncbi:RNA 2',3'-cyclic phosphodiesterase [Algoriphagus jejuensis]
MKVIQKYFLALVPPAEILRKANDIKLRVRDEFGIKYALKSPPHITLKMPFNYNESKESQLVERLEEHLRHQAPFTVKISGVGSFGKRVVYLGIEKSEPLLALQRQLNLFCKQQLHLVDELSDRNFHPHMTVAFKDLKPSHFSDVLEKVKEHRIDTEYSAAELTLLKRIERVWISQCSLPFKG